jgi:hypothetical protein
MKNLLLCLGIILIATPFVLLCLYTLTPWEPYRGEAAAITGFISIILGWLSIMASLEIRIDR